eukprot:891688_1
MGNFETTLNIITLSWTIPTTLLGIFYIWKFWMLQDLFIIKGRQPRLVIISMISTMLYWLNLMTAGLLTWTEASCGIYAFLLFTFLLGAWDITILRCWIIYSQIVLRRSEVEESQPLLEQPNAPESSFGRVSHFIFRTWFIRHKYLLSDRYQRIFLIILWSLRSINNIYMGFDMSPHVNGCLGTWGPRYFPFISLVIYALIIMSVWKTLRKFTDNFGFISELKSAFCVLVTGIVLYMAVIMLGGDFRISDKMFIAMSQAQFVVSVIIPVHKQ